MYFFVVLPLRCLQFIRILCAINLFYRTNLSQIAEKYHSILPNIELINYLCSSKCFNLWMVTDIE